MANTKISALTSVTQQNIDSINDVLPIVNASATKKATAYAITYSSLNASASTSFVFGSTPTVGARVGVQGTGTSWIFNTPSGNPSFASGLVVDGSYDGSTYQSEVNLRAAGIYSGGPYGSELSLWTSLGTAINRRVTVKANGDVNIIAGNLIQGTAAKGINFTANSAAAGKTSQLLNWYEEGTFTPVVADATTGGNTGTAALAKGRYTRVGRLITVTIAFLDITTTGMTAGNTLYIRGLPYTSITDAFVNFQGSQSNSQLASTNGAIYPVLGNNSSVIYLLDGVAAGSNTTLKVSAITSGQTDLYITLTYEAA